MSLKNFTLLEGAILISDAHYSDLRPQLLDLLIAIEKETISPTQLILMGDIFDLLFGPIIETHVRNQKMIDVINSISQRIEVYYFEGNHDFALASLFPNVTIFPLSLQPVNFTFEGKQGKMAHGDFGEDLGYKIYTYIIRSQVTLRLLGWFDTFANHILIKKLDAYLSKKEDCNDFTNFEAYVKRRLKQYEDENIDYFVEGHFHQNRCFNITNFVYINLAAFACNQRYFIVQSKQERDLLRQILFTKESSA